MFGLSKKYDKFVEIVRDRLEDIEEHVTHQKNRFKTADSMLFKTRLDLDSAIIRIKDLEEEIKKIKS